MGQLGMSREALRLAHELILAMRDTDAEHWDTLEEAAAELRRLHAALAEPEQEPVAWGVFDGPNLHDVNFTEEEAQEMMRLKGDGSVVKPLFTAPTPRRPLTDEEIDRITDQQWGQDNHKPIYAAHRAYARAIEAKLKEKNA